MQPQMIGSTQPVIQEPLNVPSAFPCGDMQGRKFAIWTDLEPDDRRALEFASAHIAPEQVAFVGSTVAHAARKQALVQKLLSQLGWKDVPVYQGTGKEAAEYGNVKGRPGVKVGSVKAATTYVREGRNILSESQLEQVSEQPRFSSEAQHALYKTLANAYDKGIEILMIAPPTDLAQVLTECPELKSKIHHVHIMGGWSEIKIADNTIERRTTYNWDMDPEASAAFMKMCDEISTTVYDTILMRTKFSGAINKERFPNLIQKIQDCTPHLDFLQDAEKALKSWNQHVMETIPALRPIIEPYADHQFTPADLLAAACMVKPALIRKVRPITIEIDPFNQTERGSLVHVRDNPSSKIMLVEDVDIALFEEEVIKAYDIHMQRIQTTH